MKVHKEKGSSWANSLKLSIVSKFRLYNHKKLLNSMLTSIGFTQGLKPLIFHYLAMNATSDESMRKLIVNWDTVSDFNHPYQYRELREYLTKLICNEIEVFGFNDESTHLMVKMLKMIESEHKLLCQSYY
jgi:hypothetical protein